MLAWAINVDRVHGLSLDRAVIDLGADILEHGQAYVALSRVRSVDGVMLIGLTRTAFTKNKRVVHGEYAQLVVHGRVDKWDAVRCNRQPRSVLQSRQRDL